MSPRYPAFPPGTRTPEVGGLSSWEALDYVRALAHVLLGLAARRLERS